MLYTSRYIAASMLLSFSALCSGVSIAAAQENAAKTSRRAEFLVDAHSLNSQIQNSSPSILDVRERAAFAKAHIAGSAWVDMNAWRTKGSEKFGMHAAEYWSQQLAALGVDPQRPIVVVGGEAVTEAARCWWLLKYCGMPNVKLLDGGFRAWTDAGLRVTDQAASIKPTTPKIEFQAHRLAELKDLLPEARAAANCQVIDNRSDEEFTGKRQMGARGGHIPSATHLEWTRFVDASNGKFLADEALGKLIAEHKIDLSKPSIAHCQTGGRSSVAALVFEMLGGKDVRNYYAGWAEYSGQLTAPVERP